MSQQITPSRMNLALFKQKIISAKKGHELLKKKCDALKAKFRGVMTDLLKYKKDMGDQSNEANLLFIKAQVSAGEFNHIVMNSVKRATIKIDINADNIAGVMLPIMTLQETEDSDSNMNQIGISKGGAQIQITRDKFRDLVKLLVKIASCQTSFVTLDQVIKVTNRRVNALEHIVIPRFQATVSYIDQELDELSREDFFRLKKVLDNKKKLIIQEEADAQKQIEQLKQQGIKVEATSSLLDNAPKDEDIVF